MTWLNDVYTDALKSLLRRESTLNTWMPPHEIFRRLPKRKAIVYDKATMTKALNKMFNFVSDVSFNSVDGVYAATMKKSVNLAPGKRGCMSFYLFSKRQQMSIPLDTGIFQKAWDKYAATEMGKTTMTKASPRKKHKTGTDTEEGGRLTSRENMSESTTVHMIEENATVTSNTGPGITNTGNASASIANDDDARVITPQPPFPRPSWQYNSTNNNGSMPTSRPSSYSVLPFYGPPPYYGPPPVGSPMMAAQSSSSPSPVCGPPPYYGPPPIGNPMMAAQSSSPPPYYGPPPIGNPIMMAAQSSSPPPYYGPPPIGSPMMAAQSSNSPPPVFRPFYRCPLPPPPLTKPSPPPKTRKAKLEAVKRLYRQEYGTDFMDGDKNLESFFQNLLQET